MYLSNSDKILKYSRLVIIIISIIGLTSIIIEYGFNIAEKYTSILHSISYFVVAIYVLYQLILLIHTKPKSLYFKSHLIEFIFSIFITIEFILTILDLSIVTEIGSAFSLKNMAAIYIVLAQLFIIVGIFLSVLRYNAKILQSKIHPSRLLFLSFLITIAIGTLLLLLPAASVNNNLTFIDALFTSTSAVCVTGLISVDTATFFTPFGQIVIMILFQIGGLGLMTFTSFFAIFLSGGIGIKERIMLHDLLDEENIGAVTKLLSYIISLTFIIELLGSLFIFLSVYQKIPNLQDAIFTSIFHSVSAFCNAGFSIFTLNLMDPFANNLIFTLTISFLIILGGIGFPTILSIIHHKKRFNSHFRFPLQTKVVLITSLALIIIGTLATFILEYNNSLQNLSLFDKVYHSYFQSVSSRTAGFNTLDISSFLTSTSIFYLILMFIGASPGGTGGGIKTTTFVILMKASWTLIRNKPHLTIGHRTIPKEIIQRAFTKFFISILILSVCIFILTIIEKSNLIDLIFESVSAYGTVGLSRGITAILSKGGKIIIIILMFIGRIGPLVFLFSLVKTFEPTNYDLPEENMSIM